MNLSGWIGVLRTLDVQTTIVQAHGLGILARGSVHQHVAITTLYKMGEMGGVTMLLDYGYWMSYGQVMSPVYPLMVFVLPGVLTAVRVLAQRNGYEEVANVLGRGELYLITAARLVNFVLGAGLVGVFFAEGAFIYGTFWGVVVIGNAALSVWDLYQGRLYAPPPGRSAVSASPLPPAPGPALPPLAPLWWAPHGLHGTIEPDGLSDDDGGDGPMPRYHCDEALSDEVRITVMVPGG